MRTGGLAYAWIVLAACGSSQPATPAAPAAPGKTGPSAEVVRAQADQEDRAKREEAVAAHRKIEEEQQVALAASCDEPEPRTSHARCTPSCYAAEAADPRAGKKLSGAGEIQHLVCQRVASGQGTGPFMISDELGAKLQIRPVRGRFPQPHKKGTWQAEIEAALAEAANKPARGDAIVVTGSWRATTHPLTRERLQCVTVAHYTKSLHHALDGCGADGEIACEASGNAAAHGLNVVHFRLAEARQLQVAGKQADCQQAALEAIAVARGMPRWRQYAKLNVQHWQNSAGYRTRFDGIVDEDTLFATAASLGGDAESVFTACGGASGASTTVEQEQSFHTCW